MKIYCFVQVLQIGVVKMRISWSSTWHRTSAFLVSLNIYFKQLLNEKVCLRKLENNKDVVKIAPARDSGKCTHG